MRALRIAIGLVAFATFGVASSEAATLPFSGTLSLSFGLTGDTLTVTTTSAGVGTSAGIGGAAAVAASTLSIGGTVVVSPPTLASLAGGFGVCASGLPTGTQINVPQGSCAPSQNGSLGALAFNGTTGTGALLASAYFLSLSPNNSIAAEIPLAVVGQGGSSTFNLLSLVTGTITGNPWQLGAITVSGTSSNVTTVLTATGFDNRTAGGTGTLQLVTPILLSLSGGQGSLPSVATLTLNFVPEPGTALLLGSGIVGLVVLGRRRVSV